VRAPPGARRSRPGGHPSRARRLDRASESVLADVAAGYLSHETAREIYFVVYDEENLAVDAEASTAARNAECAARKARGVPYAEFVASWVAAEPPSHLPYYGSWGDDNSVIHATAWTTHGPAARRWADERTAANLPARPERTGAGRPAG
jgi:hypothetical protein